jgi:hypothetical protein
MAQSVVERVADLVHIPRGCVLGNALIDEERAVHGCCWAATVSGSPFSVSTRGMSLSRALDNLENINGFQAVRARGFIDALTPRGQEALVDLVKGSRFANECQICLTAMRHGKEALWRQHAGMFREFPSVALTDATKKASTQHKPPY